MRTRALLCIALVVGLAGCTAQAPTPIVSTTPVSSPAPAPTAAPPTIASGVVGTATVGDVDVSVIHLDGGYALGGLSGQDGSLTLMFTPAEVSAGGCLDGTFTGFSAGGAIPDTEVLATDTQYGGDPTYFRTAALVDLSDPNATCWYRVVSAGAITWMIPPLYADLIIADAGESSGALGSASLEAGAPVAYRVRQADVMEAIAARFGLTTEQLLWLNPRRVYESPVARTDEVLNLAEGLR